MGHRRRFAFSPGQKILLWASGLLCLWQIIQVPAVFDPILDFYAAGVVPGTSIVLAPDTVLHFLLAFLVSCIAVVCYRQFGRRPRRRMQTAAMTPSPELPIIAPTAVAPVDAPPIRQYGAITHSWMVRLASDIYRYARAGLRHLGGASTRGWQWARPYLVRFGRMSTVVLSRIGNGLVAVVIWILAVESALAIWTWRYMEPRIRHFDRWLERKVNANPYGVRLVRIVQLVARMVTNAKERAVARSEGTRR